MVTILARSNSKKKIGGSTGARKDWNVERFLIKVTVVGSAGPIRFVVKEGERVSDVIAIVLRSYAREGRRPILGSDHRDFLLYSSTYGSGVLPHWKALSSHEGRNFVICKKQKVVVSPEFGHGRAEVGSGKVNNRGSIWKSLFHSLKVSSH
ncbi:hypothetical protein ZOSMA_64G00160 [Zostera marina]|uniref:DUF7054 domain-containing protein n=1 Tax=Zostera marina TaxID=29655 RepID=A0A0K9NSP6_ZOSMR|nr:hypothetical protein ZOSMA_64G00160 [Zostera marina]